MSDKGQAGKKLIAGVFGRAAPTYDQVGPRFFTHFGRRLVAVAQIPVGATVLDVATGRGAVLFPAVAQVEALGSVVGIDLSEPMLRDVAAEIRRRGLPNATIQGMDAEQLAFQDASFDRVLCGFALFFFPDLDRALGEFFRVLKPGGLLAASTWGPMDDRWSWVSGVLKTYQEPVQLTSQNLDNPLETQAIVHRAGFDAVQVIPEEGEFVYQTEEEWWAARWSYSSRASLERMSPQTLEKYKADLFARMQPLKQPDGFHVKLRVFYVVGSKPMPRPTA